MLTAWRSFGSWQFTAFPLCSDPSRAWEQCHRPPCTGPPRARSRGGQAQPLPSIPPPTPRAGAELGRFTFAQGHPWGGRQNCDSLGLARVLPPWETCEGPANYLQVSAGCREPGLAGVLGGGHPPQSPAGRLGIHPKHPAQVQLGASANMSSSSAGSTLTAVAETRALEGSRTAGRTP